MNTEMNEGIKVYELAKELGFDSLSFISKLKEISIVVGLVAGIVPAMKAANLNPVDAMRSK